MRFKKIAVVIILALILIYFWGPQPSSPRLSADLPVIPVNPPELETFIRNKESQHKIKTGNEAEIIWFNDSLKNKTEYAVVYIHGFSASREEGNPVHMDFAKKFGCNLFLSRLDEHGIDTVDAMVNLTADKLWNSAKEAFAIGKQLGKKVILVSTSTGGTLALKLAEQYPEISGLVLLSPNIKINNGSAWLLNNPWGLQIARMIEGNYIRSKDTTALYGKYWYRKYRVESAVQLEELLETTMRGSVFEKIKQPVLLLYYYKDEQHQDAVVKVSAMKRMFAQLGTLPDEKTAIAIPGAGDHVIGSYIKSKDIKTVETEMEKFAKDVLHLKMAGQ